MEVFGAFEVVSEMSSARGVTVYRARRRGTKGDSPFVVKLYSGTDSFGGDTTMWRREDFEKSDGEARPLNDLKSFALSIERHCAVQQAAPKAFIQVLEWGKDGRGAWYVARAYPRSVKRIIDQKVVLEAQGIFNVISSITRAARKLKQITGQGHGNIKPSNIFVTGRSHVRGGTRIVVADPCPAQPGDSVSHEMADLHAIGEVLFRLVHRRDVSAAQHMPIRLSGEWTQSLGKNAEAWVHLCERLILAGQPGHEFSLEELGKQLRKLRPGKAMRWLMRLGVAAVVVGGVVYAFTREGGDPGSTSRDSIPSGAVDHPDLVVQTRMAFTSVSVYQDGVLRGKADGGVPIRDLTPGVYEVRVSGYGCASQTNRFTLEDRPAVQTFNVELQQLPLGQLLIVADGQGAARPSAQYSLEFFPGRWRPFPYPSDLGGLVAGREIPVLAGKWRVVLRREGQADQRREVQVTPGETVQVDFTNP